MTYATNTGGGGDPGSAVSVSNFPATQPVSGSVAATQSGTWNVGTLTGITNPVAVTGAFYQATQPVSAAVLPLPSNAAQETSGNLDTLVAMGKLSAELITIHKQQLGMLRAIYLQLANISGIGSAPDDINDATLQ